MQSQSIVLSLGLVMILAGCATSPPPQKPQKTEESTPTTTKRYQLEQDIAPDEPIALEHIEDAQPQYEPYSLGGNKSYSLNGKRYQIIQDTKDFHQTGTASWYGKKFHGHLTSNGEVYDMYSMTAAHKTLPLPSYVKVTNLDNQRTAIVRVNDRGPFHADRIIDLSYAAATKLGIDKTGTAHVALDIITSPQPSADNPTLPTSGYMIQLASLKFLPNARTLAQEIGQKLSVENSVSRHENVYRVDIGPLFDYALAQETLEKVKDLGYETAFIKNWSAPQPPTAQPN